MSGLAHSGVVGNERGSTGALCHKSANVCSINSWYYYTSIAMHVLELSLPTRERSTLVAPLYSIMLFPTTSTCPTCPSFLSRP